MSRKVVLRACPVDAKQMAVISLSVTQSPLLCLLADGLSEIFLSELENPSRSQNLKVKEGMERTSGGIHTTKDAKTAHQSDIT
jgi:hypothetical protein